MATLDEIAEAALGGDALQLRSLVQDWLRPELRLEEVPCPATRDAATLAVAAGLAELFAERAHQPAPNWTSVVGGLPEAVYLVRSAATMRRLRRMCAEESPEPLRRRNLFVLADFLVFV